MAIGRLGRQVYSAPLQATQTIPFALTDGEPGCASAVPGQVNDLVVVSMEVTYQGTSVNCGLAATNYLARYGEVQRADSANGNYRGQYRYMPATPDTGITITATTIPPGAILTVVLQAFRGIATSGITDGVAGVSAGGINGGTPNPGSITSSATASNGTILLVDALSSFNADQDLPHTFGAFTAPSGAAFDDVFSYSSGGKGIAGDAWGTITQATKRVLANSTAYDPAAATWDRGTVGSDTWQAWTSFLKWDGSYVVPTPVSTASGGGTLDPAGAGAAQVTVTGGATGSISIEATGEAQAGSPAALTAAGGGSIPISGSGVVATGFIPSGAVLKPLAPGYKGTDLRVALNLLISETGANTPAIPLTSGKQAYRKYRAATEAVFAALGAKASAVPRLPKIASSDTDVANTVNGLIAIALQEGPATAPVITGGPTTFETPESPTTSILIGVYTSDQTVLWTVVGPDAALFDMDQETGELRLDSPTDRESQATLAVTVVATTPAGRTATRDVAGTILNVLDAPPLQVPILSANSVQENAAAGFVVATVSNIVSGATWSLTGTASGRFAKSGDTIVATSTVIDWEAIPVVNGLRPLGIQITQDLADSPNAPLITDFTIFVTDQAEGGGPDVTAPVITGGATTFSITENVPAGQVISTYTANEPVTWGKTGADAALFNLNASTLR